VRTNAVGSQVSDEAALLRLFNSCARRLHRYLARRVGAQVADDLVSDAFLIVWEQRADRDLDGDDARAWLYGVATNLLRGHVRTEQTRLRHLALEAPCAAAGDDPQTRVVNVVDARALAERLGPLVAELRPEERDVLLLMAWGELSLTEIATATSVPVATVRTRLHRARARLRRRLAVRADAHRLLRAVSVAGSEQTDTKDKQEDRHA
jgi:RNA polymerase sigma factor (sigma-70 family)